MAGVFIEPELINGVGSVAGNVGHEGKFVGRVSLHGVGARGRFQPFNGWASYRSVISDGVYRRVGTLIVGGQQKPTVAVRGQKGRSCLRRHVAGLGPSSRIRRYPIPPVALPEPALNTLPTFSLDNDTW